MEVITRSGTSVTGTDLKSFSNNGCERFSFDFSDSEGEIYYPPQPTEEQQVHIKYLISRTILTGTILAKKFLV